MDMDWKEIDRETTERETMISVPKASLLKVVCKLDTNASNISAFDFAAAFDDLRAAFRPDEITSCAMDTDDRYVGGNLAFITATILYEFKAQNPINYETLRRYIKQFPHLASRLCDVFDECQMADLSAAADCE